MKKNKKFFETTTGQIIRGAATVLAPKLVQVLEGATSVGEALNIIKSSDESEDTKLQLEQLALEHERELTKRHESDNATGLWLPSMVRPLTLCALTLSYIVGFFASYPVEILHTPLVTVFSFYFGSRGLEKIISKKL